MHDANPFNFRKDTEQDLQEQILVERLNFANDICETLEMSPEDLIGILSELVEAVEQLDELSPETLGSYLSKSVRTLRPTVGGGEAVGDPKDRKPSNVISRKKRDTNRAFGIRNAITSLVRDSSKK